MPRFCGHSAFPDWENQPTFAAILLRRSRERPNLQKETTSSVNNSYASTRAFQILNAQNPRRDSDSHTHLFRPCSPSTMASTIAIGVGIAAAAFFVCFCLTYKPADSMNQSYCAYYFFSPLHILTQPDRDVPDSWPSDGTETPTDSTHSAGPSTKAASNKR
jgi:hypothetical protein